ncbi:shikimate kinase like 1 [Wolffia australiana]
MSTTSLVADPRLASSSIPRPWRAIRASRSLSVLEMCRSNRSFNIRRPCRLVILSPIGRNVDSASRLCCSRSGNSSGARMSSVELQPSLELKAKAAEIVDALKGTSLFLVGMNGPIKTKVGKFIADALEYCYFDSDEVVEKVVGGATAARDLRQIDEKGFLESETEVLRQLSSMARLVVCAGEGATQGATNLSYLRYGISVWIDIPVDVMASEMFKEGAQFSNAEDSADAFDESVTELSRRYDKMKGGYATADANISLLKVALKLGYADLGNVTPEDIALEVLKAIENLTRAKKMMEEAGRPF